MTPNEFDQIARLLKQECGVVITPDKGYLLESRLAPVARRLGKASVDDFVRAVLTGTSRDLVRNLVEAMVTHESFFFRDRSPFDQFRTTMLPYLMKARAARREIRIWCAACSTGQEPYSLAMILKDEAAKLAGWKVDIVATDISNEILQRAQEGVYSQFEVQRGLPVQYLVKHFKQEGERWRIDPSLRSMISYRQFNLLEDPRSLGRFDIIYCRNVLIYFDTATKTQVLDRLAAAMPTDGVLVLGGAETVLGITARFEPMTGQRGLYAPTAMSRSAVAVGG